MRSGDTGWDVSNGPVAGKWNLGRPVDLAWPTRGTGTPFSPFRFAIPELLGFQGKALYLDADMMVLDDVAELLGIQTKTGYTCVHHRRTDVSVVDCSWFKDKTWWPKIADVQTRGWRVFEFWSLLMQHNGIESTLPARWNDFDGGQWTQGNSRVSLIHFTDVLRGQPYCPYDTVNYTVPWPHCKNPKAGLLWWSEYADSLGEEGMPELRSAIAQAHQRASKCVLDEASLLSRLQQVRDFSAQLSSRHPA